MATFLICNLNTGNFNFEGIRFERLSNNIEDKDFSKGNLELPDGWSRIENKQDVFVKMIVGENNVKVLTVSIKKSYKEQSMDNLKEKRFLEDIERLNISIKKGSILLPTKVGERIGKIKAKYPSRNKFYNIAIEMVNDNSNKVNCINFEKKEQSNEKSILNRCYIIETTQKDLSAEEIWNQYMELNHVENAFRDLKSDLGMRPIYHFKEKCTEAHLFISVLAYHLLNTIEQCLKAEGDTRSWKTIKEILSTHQRSTIILKNEKTFYLRISGVPESEHNEIYRSLKINNTLKRKLNKRI